MSNLINGIIERRSIRKYTADKVTKDKLELVMKAALYAPSAMNTQPWHFTVIQNAGVIDRMTSALKSASQHESVPDFLAPRVNTPQYTVNYGAPVFIIVSGDPSRGTTINDCTLAAGNIMLAAYSIGLGSCWINQLNVVCDVPEFRTLLTELGVPEDHKVYASVCMGFAEKPIPNPPNAKQELSTISNKRSGA